MLAEAPDEIHLYVNRRERKPRLEYQKHAAVEEKGGTQKSCDDGNPVVARAGDCDHAYGYASGYEDAKRSVEDDHRALKYARTARQLVQLLKDYSTPLVVKLNIFSGLCQLF